jgi:hypothetical protein
LSKEKSGEKGKEVKQKRPFHLNDEETLATDYQIWKNKKKKQISELA